MQSKVAVISTLLLLHFADISSQLVMGQKGEYPSRIIAMWILTALKILVLVLHKLVCDAHALLCHTDKRDCCSPPQTSARNRLGNWYFPNRTTIVSITETFEKGLRDYFARNRGLSVIRLYVSGMPLERGRFRCEIPNANNVMETLYANILDIGDVIISPPGPNNNLNTTFGQSLTLECYATINPYPLPHNVPPPRFEWFHGLSMEPLSGDFSMLISSTMLKDGNTYASFLNFSSLHESHAGLYTCQLGGNKRLAASRMVLVTTVQEATGYPFSTMLTDSTTITSDHKMYDKTFPPDIDSSLTGFNSGNNRSTCACDYTMTITLAAVFNISTVFIAVVVFSALLIKNKRRSWERQRDSKATTMLSENVAYGTHVNNNRFTCSLPQASTLTQQLPGLTTASDAYVEEGLCPLYETIENHPTQLQRPTPVLATNNRTHTNGNRYTTPPRY